VGAPRHWRAARKAPRILLLTATPISGSQINLSWQVDPGNVGLAGFKIYVNGALYLSLPPNPNMLSAPVIGLAPATSYRFAIAPYDTRGNEYAALPVVTQTTQVPASGALATASSVSPTGIGLGSGGAVGSGVTAQANPPAGSAGSTSGFFNPDYPRRYSYAIGGTQNASNAALAKRALNVFSYGATWPQRKGVQLEAKVSAVKALSTIATKMVPYVILTDVSDAFGTPGTGGQDYYQWYKALTDNFWFVYTNGLTHVGKVVGSGANYSKPNYTPSCPVVAGENAASYKAKYDYSLLYTGGTFNTGATSGSSTVVVQGTSSLDGKFDDNIFIQERSNGDYNVDGVSELASSVGNIQLIRSSIKANLEFWRTLAGTGPTRLELCNFADWPAYGATTMAGTQLDQLYDGGIHENIMEYYDGPRGTTATSLFNAIKLVYDACKGPKLIMLRVQISSATNYAQLRFWDAVSALTGSGMYEHFASGYLAEELGTLNWDERDFPLGQPSAGASGAVQWTPQPTGEYRRDFVGGIVLLNASTAPITVALGGTFNRLSGTFDPTTNNGQSVTSVTIPASSGLFLARGTQDTTPPTNPSSLIASATSSSAISLSWTASTDTGGSGLANYLVERSIDGTTGWSEIGQPLTNSYSSTGLSALTKYFYRVRAIDGAGLVSGYSSVANATTQSAGGGITHGQTFSITGSFTPKSTSAPTAFDQCTGTTNTFSGPWSGGWPSTAGGSNIQLQNAGYRSIAGPHARALKYLAGTHIALNTTTGGNNVMLWKNYIRPAFPYYTYWCYYYRMDPNWLFNAGYGSNSSDNDNNLKLHDFSNGAEPYDLNLGNIYFQFANNIPGQSVDGYFGSSANDDGPGTMTRPDNNGRNPTSSSDTTGCGMDVSIYSPFTAWRKYEIETKHNSSTSGWIKVWMDNHLVYNYQGRTDNFPGTTRTEAIGGYARNRSANNVRYFGDIYYDQQPGRLMLANNATYASATIAEPQGYNGWVSNEIDATCNRGALSTGPAHVHVIDPVNGNQYKGTIVLA
jgi:hypothetical protein